MGGAGEEQAEKPSYLRVQQALEQVEAKRLLGPTTTGWVAISQTNSSKTNVINQPKPGLAGELDMDRQQNHLGGLPEAKPTMHTDESRDHKQVPPEPHRTPQKRCSR